MRGHRLLSVVSVVSLASLAAETAALSTSTSPDLVRRRDMLKRATAGLASAASAATLLTPRPSSAAPPFAIMAEELGYFPVTDEKSGETVMVPSRVSRNSTPQAIELARYLRRTGARMYGAYWCPHCSRQKELFGREAWAIIDYAECAPKGYRSQFATCIERKVDGYPTWRFGNGKEQGGEMELADIARESGYLKRGTFDPSLEGGVPPLGGGAACQ